MKFLLIFFACICMLFAGEARVIKFSHVVAPTAPIGKSAEFFARRVEELSGGRLKVQVFPQAMLMDDDRVFGALRLGNVDLAVPSFPKFAPIFPEFALFDLPFLFKDEAHLYRVFDGAIGDGLKNLVAQKGFVAIDYWDTGFKHFSSSKRAIIAPDDAAGQRFRIQSSKVIDEQIRALGGVPQVMAFSEVYSALSQKVVDATENPLVNFYNSKFYEAQSSLTLSKHAYVGCLFIASEKFYATLDGEIKEAFLQAAREARDFARDETARQEAEILAKLKEYAARNPNFKLYELKEREKDEFRARLREIYPKFYSVFGERLISEVIGLGE